jgi:hypothetical protein
LPNPSWEGRKCSWNQDEDLWTGLSTVNLIQYLIEKYTKMFGSNNSKDRLNILNLFSLLLRLSNAGRLTPHPLVKSVEPEELSRHNTQTDCWILLFDTVF